MSKWSEGNLRPTVSRPISLSVGLPPGAHDQIFVLCLIIAGFLMRGHPLWREDESVIYSYNCFWALPEQSLSGPSPADQKTIFYALIWDSDNLEDQVSVFMSPLNRVDQLYPRALSSLFVASYDSQGYGGGTLTRLHSADNVQNCDSYINTHSHEPTYLSSSTVAFAAVTCFAFTANELRKPPTWVTLCKRSLQRNGLLNTFPGYSSLHNYSMLPWSSVTFQLNGELPR
jgi:hypothetical protein